MTDIEIAIETKEVVTITNENRVSNDRIVQGHKVVDIEVGRPTDKLYPCLLLDDRMRDVELLRCFPWSPRRDRIPSFSISSTSLCLLCESVRPLL
jgi:hypothetical protein